ncbi:hypothetical protein [uncultured Eubacterium sp.]|uniref:hypothetical protein n=1 Tax=uncultured Eubacterium sp. TaxID=165185 RepID=UPI0025F95937|nr:hypothetical protein [uncultured Eubacterium sp.]
MSPQIITLIISIAVCVAALILMYFLGKRNMKKRDEQQAAIDQAAQWVNMLIIDKKKLRMKESGLPQQVIDQTPKFAKLTKIPVVKAKVGPQIMVLIADNQIYDQIPVKKEVKASVSGLYISDVRGVRGPLEKPEKKRGFFAKLTGQK